MTNAGEAYGYNSNMIFKTRNAEGSPTERMRISTTGNVGIGTTSPSSRLEVYGGVYINPNAEPKLRIGGTNSGSDRGIIVDHGASTSNPLIQLKNNNGEIFYITGT